MKDLIFSIFNIFKYVGKFFSLIRNFLFNLLLIALVILVVASFIEQPKKSISPGTILRLDIAGNIVEEKRDKGSFEKYLEEMVMVEPREQETALQDILDVINRARDDENISALQLNLKRMGRAGLNQLESIGQALEHFKTSGKTVISAEDFFSQSQYYLASYSDLIAVNPMGGVDLHGFGVFRLYFKEAIDKLRINYNIFKVGTFKSALEPFTRNDMSEDDRKQNELWLSALWQLYSDQIVTNRDVSLESLQNYTTNIDKALKEAGGNTATLALNSGLVDKVWTRQQVRSHLLAISHKKSGKPSVISSTKYATTLTPSYSDPTSSSDKIGLIIAEGNILPGKQPAGLIGADSLTSLIRKAKKDNGIKGLVLRVNSGGGSAFGSEIIRQEILDFQQTGRPVVVSMGSVAASGAYWIAADADEIWASASTITGSIGIFGAIPTFEESLQSLGIYSDGIGTTPLSAGVNITRPIPDSLKNSIQQNIEQNYAFFLKIVSEGRGIELKRVEQLAQGRVYDGRTAHTLGLVDHLGSLKEAIEAAAKLAGTKDYSTQYIRRPVSVKDQFLKYFSMGQAGQAKQDFLLNTFKNKSAAPTLVNKFAKAVSRQLADMAFLEDPRGIYAHCLLRPVW